MEKLTNLQGFFILEEISYVVHNEKLLNRMNHLLDSRTKRNLDLINSTALKKWVDSCRSEIAKGSTIISGIIGNKSEYLLVEIHPERSSPSPAAGVEQKSFINHVIRHIRDQLKQLQPNSSNLIIVQGNNWTIGFGEKLWNIEPLHTAIEDFLKKNNRENLSGIGIFVSNFNKIKFIHNDYVGETFRLETTDLEKLGLQQL